MAINHGEVDGSQESSVFVEQAIDTTELPSEGLKFELMIEYFKSLREEILLSQKNRFQIAIWKFGAIAFLLGIFFNHYGPETPSEVFLILPRLLPLLSMLFDLMYFEEVRRGIIQIGDFIANVIEEEWFNKIPPTEIKFTPWEQYLRMEQPRETKILERITISQILLLLSFILVIFGLFITKDYLLFYQAFCCGTFNPWIVYWIGLLILYFFIARSFFPWVHSKSNSTEE